MRLFIAEKPSLAKAIFEGLGGNPATEKKNGCYEHGTDVVTWCFGHMLELYDPQDYDVKYAAWRFDDLPIKTPCRPSTKSEPMHSSKLTSSFLSSRKRPVSFMPETRTMKAACWLMKF